MNIYTIDFFYDLLFIMFIIGLVVFVSLYFVDAGYDAFSKWGPAMNNKVGWFLMECLSSSSYGMSISKRWAALIR